MSEFSFDDSKSFQGNCSEFLKDLESVDKEMAEILKANWDKLEEIVHEGERDSKSRIQFNDAVAAALDVLVQEAAMEKS